MRLVDIVRDKYKGNYIYVNLASEYQFIKTMLSEFKLTSDFNQKIDIIIENNLSSEEISNLNKLNCYKISLNIPSGINPKNGLIEGNAFKCNLLYVLKKIDGAYLNDAPDYYDEIVSELLPKRKSNSNKGTYGKGLIIAGSKMYSGALEIATNALLAFKMGIGYQAIAFPKNLFDLFAFRHPELLLIPICDNGDHFTFVEEEIIPLLKYDAISLGMGMQVSSDLFRLISYLLANYEGKLILDADALNTVARFGIDLKNKKCKLIITPHLKEFSRLINTDIEHIQHDGIFLAREFANKNDLVLVLKSNTTIVTDGKAYLISHAGNSGLAKAGSGDMLAGILLGLNILLDDSLWASYLGCEVLGKASRLCLATENENTMTATDIIKYIPAALDEVKE